MNVRGLGEHWVNFCGPAVARLLQKDDGSGRKHLPCGPNSGFRAFATLRRML
jgi:hypothetical protein